MKNLVVLVYIALGLNSNAQDLSFSNIDPNLIKDANVVVRKSLLEFEVLSPGKAIKSFHIELTILNSTAKRETKQYVYYSDLVKVLSLSGSIYDREGRLVRKIKKSDISDVSASGGSMYTDQRVKVVDFTYPTYPYSIVFDYKVEYDGLMFYPNWDPQESYYNSVENAEFIVSVPENLGLNYFEYMTEGSKSKLKSTLIYKWQVKNLPGIEPEPYGPPGRELSPYVMTTPKKFEMEGYNGSMSTWRSIGEYDNMLLAGQNDLPDEVISELEIELKGVSDKRAKAKLIYEFVQNTTRYVSIQLGLGGWQPYNAQYVYDNGYGDCKALTNYTAALLNQFEIESIYTSVRAGRAVDDIITEFPNTRFNHVFLAVPFERDTVWLECTSQTVPFGYTGTFTSDRHVLLATTDGGVLVKTPTYTEKQNVQKRHMEIVLSKDGSAFASVTTEYSGLTYESVQRQLDESPESQKKWLLKNVDLDKTKIHKIEYFFTSGIVPLIKEKIEVTSENFGSVTGKRIFFDANPMNKFSSVPKRVEDRKTSVHIKRSYTEVDSIQFTLPEGYHVEYLPEQVNINNDFGEYKASFYLSESGIIYVRKLVRKQGVYPPEQYLEFRSMLKEIVKADKTKIILVGST